jgi:hypothetical protein
MECRMLRALQRELLQLALGYARRRADWRMADLETRKAADAARTAAHDAFIDACNILSRNLAKRGRPNLWRQRLGDNRKEIGDFACYVHCILGIQAR